MARGASWRALVLLRDSPPQRGRESKVPRVLLPPRFDVLDHQPLLREPRVDGKWVEVKVSCSCRKWRGGRGYAKSRETSQAQAYSMHAHHVAQTQFTPRERRKDLLNTAVGFGFIALVVSAVVVVIWNGASGGNENDGPGSGDRYDDSECSALIGFARRDDILVSEKARALDEYNANC